MVSVSSLVSAELSPQDRVAEIPNALKIKNKKKKKNKMQFQHNIPDEEEATSLYF